MVHALRHTFATRLAEDGAAATEIQALLGHESLNTSQGYIVATANATRQARPGQPHVPGPRLDSASGEGRQPGLLIGDRA